MFTGWVAVPLTWRLNGRQCSALAGRRKADVLAEVGTDRFRSWRRSLRGVPLRLASARLSALRADPRLAALPADMIATVVPYRNDVLAPQSRAGALPLLVAYGDSPEPDAEGEVRALNVPTGIPLRDQFDAAAPAGQGRPLSRPGVRVCGGHGGPRRAGHRRPERGVPVSDDPAHEVLVPADVPDVLRFPVPAIAQAGRAEVILAAAGGASLLRVLALADVPPATTAALRCLLDVRPGSHRLSRWANSWPAPPDP